jgi:hypothetical protein
VTAEMTADCAPEPTGPVTQPITSHRAPEPTDVVAEAITADCEPEPTDALTIPAGPGVVEEEDNGSAEAEPPWIDPGLKLWIRFLQERVSLSDEDHASLQSESGDWTLYSLGGRHRFAARQASDTGRGPPARTVGETLWRRYGKQFLKLIAASTGTTVAALRATHPPYRWCFRDAHVQHPDSDGAEVRGPPATAQEGL